MSVRRIVRLSGMVALLVVACVIIFLVAAAYLAIKIILWLLPLIIVAIAAWVLLYVFNKPPKKQSPHLDVAFKVKG